MDTASQLKLSDDRLSIVAQLAVELGASGIAQDAVRLATRLDEGRFYVACVGQFKRGKSSLLNALVGDDILPTGVVPVTSVITILRHGDRRAVRVSIGTEWREVNPASLCDYVSEERPQGSGGRHERRHLRAGEAERVASAGRRAARRHHLRHATGGQIE